MIHSLERIGTKENHDGWFKINNAVAVKYVTKDNEMYVELKYDDEMVTEQEAYNLAEELLDSSTQSQIDMLKEANVLK